MVKLGRMLYLDLKNHSKINIKLNVEYHYNSEYHPTSIKTEE